MKTSLFQCTNTVNIVRNTYRNLLGFGKTGSGFKIQVNTGTNTLNQ